MKRATALIGIVFALAATAAPVASAATGGGEPCQAKIWFLAIGC